MIIDTTEPRNIEKAYALVWPDALRLRGSVIRSCIIYVLFMTGYSVGIAFLIDKYPGLSIQTSVMSFVSLVLSLLLVFRSNSAYDRYWEGRKLWQEFKIASRNSIRSIWSGVIEKTVEDRTQKRQAMKNIAAYIISVKRYLRGEDGIEYPDYDGLLSSKFRILYSTRTNAYNYGAINGDTASNQDAACAHTLTSLGPISNDQDESVSWLRKNDIPLPSLILYELQKFNEYIQDNHLVHVQYYASMLNQINALGATLGNCERIISTPIPLAYRIHLTHTLFLYLAVLPWALASMGSIAKTIVLQFIISFMLIGIDTISREIQNPFGYDSNDLPLDAYCDAVLSELTFALTHDSPKSLSAGDITMSSSHVAVATASENTASK